MQNIIRLVLKDGLIGVIGNWWFFFLWSFFTFSTVPWAVVVGANAVVIISIAVSFDEKSKIDTLFCSLPVKRSTYVLSKYVSTFVILGVVMGLTFAARSVVNWISPGSHRAVTIADLFFLLFPLTIFFSITFPVHFKMGGQVEKSVGYLAMVVIMTMAVIGLGLLVLLNLETELSRIKHIYLYLMTIMVVFLVASAGLAIKFYGKRDLG